MLEPAVKRRVPSEVVIFRLHASAASPGTSFLRQVRIVGEELQLLYRGKLVLSRARADYRHVPVAIPNVDATVQGIEGSVRRVSCSLEYERGANYISLTILPIRTSAFVRARS